MASAKLISWAARSKCANDKSTFKVSRPMLLVVKAWVTETNGQGAPSCLQKSRRRR
jgi:hypothetical protein